MEEGKLTLPLVESEWVTILEALRQEDEGELADKIKEFLSNHSREGDRCTPHSDRG